MSIDRQAADELLTTTRAVRKRLDFERPVPRDLIMECIAIAQQAPTPVNTQCWRWVIVEDAEKRRAIAEIYRKVEKDSGYYPDTDESGNKVSTQQERVYDSIAHLAANLQRAPYFVIPCLEEPMPVAGFGFRATAAVASNYAGIYPAMWSFMLALRARGLGSVVTTAHLVEEQKVADILGIPDTVTQCALLPVAYTIGEDFKPAKRPPAESIVHWDKW